MVERCILVCLSGLELRLRARIKHEDVGLLVNLPSHEIVILEVTMLILDGGNAVFVMLHHWALAIVKLANALGMGTFSMMNLLFLTL